MDFKERDQTGEAIVRVSNDDLITLHACIRETLEALSNRAEFRARVGVDADDAIALMRRVRAVRAALERTNSTTKGESQSDY